MEHLPTCSLAGTLRAQSGIGRLLLPVVLAAATVLYGRGPSEGKQKDFEAPDAKLMAIIAPADKKRGFEQSESRISILRNGGIQISMHDFSSKDGEHGYGVVGARWTPDSNYFVCRMSNSGGHSPMYVPVVFWSRKKNHFFQLKAYTADRIFSIAAPDKVNVESWPDLQPATVSLSRVKVSQVTVLR